MIKEILGKLLLRKVEKGFRKDNVSKTKAGAGIKFTAQSATVIAIAAFIQTKTGYALPPEIIAALLTTILTWFGGQFLQTVGERDAMEPKHEVRE